MHSLNERNGFSFLSSFLNRVFLLRTEDYCTSSWLVGLRTSEEVVSNGGFSRESLQSRSSGLNKAALALRDCVGGPNAIP